MNGARRGWRWRHNPLRRRSDVVEAWTVLAVGSAVFVGAPAAGLAAGRVAYDDARATSVAQRQERHQARAVLVADAPPKASWSGPGAQASFRVPVRWETASGATRTGTVRVHAGTREGETTWVWLDRQDRLVAAPLGGTDLWTRVGSVAAGTGAGAAGTAVLVGWSVRRRLDRGRLAEWDRAWETWDGPERGQRGRRMA
ncbi:hypothetical protein V2W30_35500 [Streptomyces sp. Q6]|uniref:Uncharacterized protein n=1 Tax=Streptomyces citrinus TaxID=3118173 RepID=A0ACD5AQM8_9ACTN